MPGKKRILVINDNQEILDMFRVLLEEEAGYEVILFSFAPYEIQQIERVHPDLVIIDFLFGSEYLGWQVVQKMRMHRPTAAIPIVICTAALPEVRAIEGQLRSHGALVVAKPFDIDELFAMVDHALSQLASELLWQDALSPTPLHAQTSADATQSHRHQMEQVSADPSDVSDRRANVNRAKAE